nr:MAG TPA: hypothetical protein [Caudoviricetes sp.]
MCKNFLSHIFFEGLVFYQSFRIYILPFGRTKYKSSLPPLYF